MKKVYQNEWNRQNHGSDLCRLSRKGKADIREYPRKARKLCD